MKEISKLHFITTNAASAERACLGGVDWVQLRLKDVSYEYFKAVALEVQNVCRHFNATFIVNDSIQLALDVNADGVHVGTTDPLPEKERNELLNKGGIIGCTANNINDFLHLQGKPVSYVGLGPFRFTETKKKLSPILGIDGYKTLFEQLKKQNIAHPPVIGIGGIKIDDVATLMDTGVYGIAISGAIGNAADITGAARKFIDVLDFSKNVN